jgi:nitrogen fixation/metabolism regulation signal transduction histidine kinase
LITTEISRLKTPEVADFTRPNNSPKSKPGLSDHFDLIQLFSPLFAEQHINIKTQCPRSSGISFDPEQIKQVLINLTKNAVGYAGRGP